jgi:hypothetical protein
MPARVSTSTINDKLKKLVEPGNVNNTLLKLAGSWGCVKFNCGGTQTDWRVLYNETEPDEYQDGDPISSARVTRYRTASLDWYSWVKSESFGKMEKLINRPGRTRLYDLVARAMAGQARDFTKFLGKMCYSDGDSTTTKSIDGLETMYSDISAQTGSATTWQRGTPAGSYAGLSMVLNDYGTGSWSSGDTWPEGTGLLPYYFFSPVVADATADWGQSATTWKENWRQCLNFCVTFTETLHGIVPKVWMTTPDNLRQAQDSLIDKERIAVSAAGNDLIKLGFRALNWNGMDIASDYNCTRNVAYGLVPKKFQVRSLLPQLLGKQGDEDITIMTDILQFESWLNMRFETPAYFPCIREIS